MTRLAVRGGIAVAVLLILAAKSMAYDPNTHRLIGERSADASVALERALRNDLVRAEGRNVMLHEGSRALRAREWIGAGAFEEDEPPGRALNHFHNPLRPWSSAGLTFLPGLSSVLWAQHSSQDPSGGRGGQWSWSTAREAYLDALTGPMPRDREANLARTLRALGHATHLIQDAAVPAHVRNDPHLTIEVFDIRIPVNPDPYEDWAERFRKQDEDRFQQMLSTRVVSPAGSVFRPTGDERAPVPIAGLIDTQDFRLRRVVRGVFDPVDAGIAEFVNPNYLSGDTIFKNFALPRVSQLGTPFFELDDAKFRRYWPKMAGGGAAVEVAHFVAEGALYESLFDLMPDPPGVAWVLDDRVAEDYAADLLPRAVGYSAALIDYFFRGRLDVDLFDNVDAGDPSQLRVEGRNASDEPLVDGGLLLFADRVDGTRERLAPVSGSIDDAIVRGVAAGGDVVSTWFQASSNAERFVAVYQGTLGDEQATPSFPGAVIGKVIGGVRVEHVFADGEIWKIRTPAGVFPSPLTTAEFEDVRWGNAADVLVARTWFGDGQPNRFSSFAVQRRPGSIDLVTDPDSGMLMLRDLATAEFPFGAPLGTTVVFDQVIRYRQRLARVNPVIVRLREMGPGGPYGGSNRSQSESPAIGEVRARDFSFSDVFHIVLDASHNLQFNALGAERYLWDVTGFTADADGRILAIIQVFLFAPANQTQSIEFLGLNFTTGDLEEHARAYVAPFLPIDAGPIWALLDVEAGRVLASTAGSELAITSEARAEAPPFADPSYVRLGPFVPMSAPGIWLKVFEFYEDGRIGGVLAERLWSVVPVDEFSEDRYPGTLSIRAETQSAVGLKTLAATGLRRQDLAASLPVSTAVDVRQITRDMHYLELNEGQHDALRIELSEGVAPTPTQLFDARTWGAGATPKLVLLAQDSDAAGGAAHVVAWDHEAGRATLVADLPSGFHGLKSATASAALVTSYLHPELTPAGFVVHLDAARPAIEFFGESLGSFTLLDPSHLYNAEDTKFYRLSPPLRKTALPATLAGSPEVSGDFHAIRLP